MPSPPPGVRWIRSVGERTHEPDHFVDANPLAGCLNSAVSPLSSLYSAARRALCLFSAAGQLPRVTPRRHARQIFVQLPGRT
jgi:hypothetical protein